MDWHMTCKRTRNAYIRILA